MILILTAKNTTADKVIGLDAEADNYLVKPFELEELSTRKRNSKAEQNRAYRLLRILLSYTKATSLHKPARTWELLYRFPADCNLNLDEFLTFG